MQKKNRAVFIDRDGTLIHFVSVLSQVSQLRLLPGAGSAVRKLNRLGYLTILITNQPSVARGLFTEATLENIHDVLRKRLKRVGARLDAIYVCPHHPDGSVERYRRMCACRKPGIGMIMKAKREFNLDLSQSFLIGDTTRDIQAGNRARLSMILVKTGEGGRDKYQFKGTPDFVARDLEKAVRIIGNRD